MNILPFFSLGQNGENELPSTEAPVGRLIFAFVLIACGVWVLETAVQQSAATRGTAVVSNNESLAEGISK